MQTCSTGTHSTHVMSRGKMHVCWWKCLYSLSANMLIICLFKAQMSSDTAGSLRAVVNQSESFQSWRTGTLTNRDHCVQIPHGHSLDGPSWNFCTASFIFDGEIEDFWSVNECESMQLFAFKGLHRVTITGLFFSGSKWLKSASNRPGRRLPTM